MRKRHLSGERKESLSTQNRPSFITTNEIIDRHTTLFTENNHRCVIIDH